MGFEPTLPFRVNTLSKRAPSATRPSLRDRFSGRGTRVAAAAARMRMSYFDCRGAVAVAAMAVLSVWSLG